MISVEVGHPYALVAILDMADHQTAFKGISFEAFMLQGANFEVGARSPDVTKMSLECFTNQTSHFILELPHLNYIQGVV